MSDRQALDLQSLSDALWTERHELELLLAKVVALRLVLQAGEHRFVSACLDEVEASMTALASQTDARGAVLAEVAPATDTLKALAAQAPPPMGWALAEHATSLTGLLADLDTEVASIRRLARSAREQTMDALSIARSQGASDPAALGSTMELELRAQACRGVLVSLCDLAPDLRRFITRPD